MYGHIAKNKINKKKLAARIQGGKAHKVAANLSCSSNSGVLRSPWFSQKVRNIMGWIKMITLSASWSLQCVNSAMKTKHWPRTRYMYAHTHTHSHAYHAWCHLCRGRKEPCKHTYPHSHYDNIHTRHDTWDRNSILTSYNQTKRKRKKEKKRPLRGKTMDDQ